MNFGGHDGTIYQRISRTNKWRVPCQPRVAKTLRDNVGHEHMNTRAAIVMILAALCCLQSLAGPSDETVTAKATRSGSLLGKWDVVKGKELPSSLQLQFTADVYIESLDLLDHGKLRVTRPRNWGLSEGKWSYTADGKDSGMLHLVYPRWGRSTETNSHWLSVDFEDERTMKTLNLTDVPTILKKRTVNRQEPNQVPEDTPRKLVDPQH
jgi:hypothetical protein